MFVLFLVSWIGQFYFQYQHELDEARSHGESGSSMLSADFLNAFWASTFENWQSEFLPVQLRGPDHYLIHRHSHESRDSNDEMAADIRAIREKLQ